MLSHTKLSKKLFMELKFSLNSGFMAVVSLRNLSTLYAYSPGITMSSGFLAFDKLISPFLTGLVTCL